LFPLLIASSLAVKQCMMYSNGLVEEVRDCKREWTHDVNSHGCYYAFNYPNSTTLRLETQGTCGAHVCTSGKEDCTVTSTTQRDGGITTTMMCCCYSEKCNPRKRAETLRDSLTKKN
ncbi:hypothetical protein PMAYCL1PPCAC_12597, partial [Pristionchus mayeri]